VTQVQQLDGENIIRVLIKFWTLIVSAALLSASVPVLATPAVDAIQAATYAGAFDRAQSLARAELARATDDRARAQMLRWIGTTQIATSDLEGAQASLRQSETLARRVGSAEELGLTLIELGTLLARSGELSAARPLYREGIAALRVLTTPRSDIRRQLALGLYSLGSVEISLDALNDAAAHYAEALTEAKSLGDRNLRANFLIGDSALRLRRKDFAGAVEAARAAVAEVDAMKPGYERTFAWIALANAERLIGRPAQAQEAAGNALQEADSTKPANATARNAALRAVAEAIEARGDERAAITAWKNLAQAQKQSFGEERAAVLARAEAGYNAKAREFEIARLAQRDTIVQLSLARQRIVALGAGAALALLMVIAALLWRHGRRQRAANAALSQRNAQIQAQASQLASVVADKDTLLRELEHRVRNNLHVVRSLIDLQTRNARRGDIISVDALRDVGSRIYTIVQLHGRLSARDSPSAVDMQSFLTELADYVDELFGSLLTTEVICDGVVLPLDQASPIGLITCELLANAHKHGRLEANDTLSIHLQRTMSSLVLVVADSGIGLTQSKRNSGLGESLVESLAGSISGTVSHAPHRAGARPGVRWTINIAAPSSALPMAIAA
jgi:two-component sensor histidine kinase